MLPAPREVAGVATTAVRWQVPRPGRPGSTIVVRWYAEDADGNVWWFGQRVVGHGLRTTSSPPSRGRRARTVPRPDW